jgi:arginase
VTLREDVLIQIGSRVEKPVSRFAVIDAPSILGLKPTGVETLPDALKNAGLIQGLQAEYAGRVDVPRYESERDKSTLILNPHSIQEFSLRLAEKVADVRGKNRFPVVLGGDCSILIGCMLALRRLGKYGLFFIDGHADFYQPEAEPNGEVASMELAIVSGRGPSVLTNIGGLKPLVQEEDIIAFGYRDTEEQKQYDSQDIRETSINAFDLEQVRALGIATAAKQAIDRLEKNQINGFWIHLDADVLNDAIMPAVDYRLAGGLHWDELSVLLRALMASGQAVGLTITIFNPKFDLDRSIASKFTQSIIAGLSYGPVI